MSYILDALQRANAERERATVPGLHARPVVSPLSPGLRGGNSRVWLVGAVVLTLACSLAALWLRRAPDSGVELAAPAPAQAPSSPLSSSPARVIAVTASAGSKSPAVVPGPKLPPLPSPVSAPASSAMGANPSANKDAKAAVEANGKTDEKTDVKTVAAVASRELPLLGDMPQDIRGKIPALQISGAVYAQSPGQRLLIVNGQVLSQGSLAAPGVSLEEIGPHSSVFDFQGARFRIAH